MGGGLTREQRLQLKLEELDDKKHEITTSQREVGRKIDAVKKQLDRIDAADEKQLRNKILEKKQLEAMYQSYDGQAAFLMNMRHTVEQVGVQATTIDMMAESNSFLETIQKDARVKNTTVIQNTFVRNADRMKQTQKLTNEALSIQNSDLDAEVEDEVAQLLAERRIRTQANMVSGPVAEKVRAKDEEDQAEVVKCAELQARLSNL